MKLLYRIVNKLKSEINKFRYLIIRDKDFLRYENSSKMILILVPNQDQINGGVLSLVSIFNEFLRLKNIHECEVVASTHPYLFNKCFLKFSKFKNNMDVFDLKMVLKKIKNVKELHIHIPELFVEEFILSFEKEWEQKDIDLLLNMNVLHINILNQNDMLMPKVIYIEKIKKHITKNVTMTVAHKKYATIEKRIQYKVPLHYLSAWVNSVAYVVNNFNIKENVILFSPDELSRLNLVYHLSKKDLIDMLRVSLPNFRILVIENLSYEDYKSLVSKSKFMVTFGEGLDGYFVETILSGGIAFAVYNEDFFTLDYKNLPTVYPSVDCLFKNIANDINYYNDDFIFEAYNAKLRDIVEIEYSYVKYQNRVKNFILGNYDFK